MGEHWDLSRCELYEIRGDATIQDSNLRLPALRTAFAHISAFASLGSTG